MSNYYTECIVKPENIDSLWDAYNGCPSYWCHQDWNLFNLEKRAMGRHYWKQFQAVHDIDSYVFEKFGARTHVHYFLKYGTGAYTRIHQDNKDTVTKTVITFLEETPDLVGGDTFVIDKHYNTPAPEGATNKGNDCHGLNAIPTTLKLPQYSSLVYDWNVPHGVTRVFSGHRIVLVSWYVGS